MVTMAFKIVHVSLWHRLRRRFRHGKGGRVVTTPGVERNALGATREAFMKRIGTRNYV